MSPCAGRVRYPQAAQDAGPFPLVLVVHGNKTSTVPSHQGFDYLLDLLASHGMIAVSVDETFLNGSGGEMDARAIVLLRHRLHASSFDALPYPEPADHPMKGDVTKTILKTVRIPLSRFLAENPNLDLQALTQIQLLFDRQPSGLLAIDDLQLTW